MLLPARELVREAIAEGRIEGRELHDLAHAVWRATATTGRPNAMLSADREMREQRPVLRDVADAATVRRHRGAGAGQCPVAEQDRPASGRSKPAISRSSVLLPLPEAPTIAVRVPLRHLEADVVRARRMRPNVFETPETERSSGAAFLGHGRT